MKKYCSSKIKTNNFPQHFGIQLLSFSPDEQILFKQTRNKKSSTAVYGICMPKTAVVICTNYPFISPDVQNIVHAN